MSQYNPYTDQFQNPTPKPRKSRRIWIGLIMAGLFFLGLIFGIAGGSGDTEAAPAPTVTVTAEAEPAPTVTVTTVTAEPIAPESVVAKADFSSIGAMQTWYDDTYGECMYWMDSNDLDVEVPGIDMVGCVDDETIVMHTGDTVAGNEEIFWADFGTAMENPFTHGDNWMVTSPDVSIVQGVADMMGTKVVR